MSRTVPLSRLIGIVGILAALLPVGGPMTAAAAALPPAQMVKDIWPGGSPSYPSYTVAFDGRVFFNAKSDSVSGQELWASDGTDAGTALVKDIDPADYGQSRPQQLTVAGTKLFFVAETPAEGEELWVSDGTPTGTTLVKDIKIGSGSSYTQRLTAVGSSLFFVADDGTNGKELWVSDGTPTGTTLVKDINPGGSNSEPTSPTAFGGKLYFVADDGVNGRELWVSNGTALGTFMVKDINPTAGESSAITTNPLMVAGSKIYFKAEDGTHGPELWASDGTGAGTALVKDIDPTDYTTGPGYMAAVGSTLFFGMYTPEAGLELWKSGGTAGSTVLVKDIAAGSDWGNPQRLVAMGGTLYFTADNGTVGHELWKSDGTSGGTILVKDIKSGSGNGFWPYASDSDPIVAIGPRLFFRGDDGTNGVELWVSDGTTDGTLMAGDIKPGGDSNPRYMVGQGDKVFFSANDGTHSLELWVMDFTPPPPPCDLSGVTTLSQGGWSNTATTTPLSSSWFTTAFASGLTIGGASNSVLLTTADNVRRFLPQSGTPAVLSGSRSNLTNKQLKNTLAGQAAALTLNLALNPILGDAELVTGYSGTVADLLAAVNAGLNNTGSPSKATLANLSKLAETVNLNFPGGVDQGRVVCPPDE